MSISEFMAFASEIGHLIRENEMEPFESAWKAAKDKIKARLTENDMTPADFDKRMSLISNGSKRVIKLEKVLNPPLLRSMKGK